MINEQDTVSDDSLEVDELIRNATNLIHEVYNKHLQLNISSPTTSQNAVTNTEPHLSVHDIEIARINEICDTDFKMPEDDIIEIGASPIPINDSIVSLLVEEPNAALNGDSEGNRSQRRLATSNRPAGRKREGRYINAEGIIVNNNSMPSCNDVVYVGTTHRETIIDVIDLSTPDRSVIPDRIDTPRKRNQLNTNARNFGAHEADNSANTTPVLMCVICMESMLGNDPTSTKCGHVFCRQCITTTISMTKKCPLCNKKLTVNNLNRLYFN